jgi:hypothetical protein
MDSDTVTRVLVEVATGKPPAVPDDAEVASLRAQLKLECDEIRAAGFDVDVPHEVPDAS